VPFVTDSDVKVKYDRVAHAWAAIAQAASGSADKLTAGEQATMGLLAGRVEKMLADEPSLFRAGSQADTADALERDVWSFADDLRSAGFAGVPQKPQAAPQTTLDRAIELAPLILIALAAAALLKR
jgi:hypothetical protein